MKLDDIPPLPPPKKFEVNKLGHLNYCQEPILKWFYISNMLHIPSCKCPTRLKHGQKTSPPSAEIFKLIMKNENNKD